MAKSEVNYCQTHLTFEGETWSVAGKKFTLRRIGWLDQRGRIWTAIPPQWMHGAKEAGSFEPLLIAITDDD